MFYLGLDLGDMRDFAALVIIQKLRVMTENKGFPYSPVFDLRYHVRYAQRFELGTTYPAICEAINKLTETNELSRQYLVILDATGVGRPVYQLLREKKILTVPVTITAGAEEVYTPEGEYHVPKRILVSNLQVLFQTGRLKFADELPELSVLIEELQKFRAKISVSGHDTYEAWRENDHDDLVLALALAAWYAERYGQVPQDKGRPPQTESGIEQLILGQRRSPLIR
ncbi:MAG: hypothetical protein ABSE06_18300 [Anaerolineaceae bacterium]|jgi:hypothetical protein